MTVRATDNDGLTFDKTLTISLIDHNERPTANPDGFGDRRQHPSPCRAHRHGRFASERDRRGHGCPGRSRQ